MNTENNKPKDTDKCTSCPECGETETIEIYGFGKDHRICAKCHQEYFTTIFYECHINNPPY